MEDVAVGSQQDAAVDVNAMDSTDSNGLCASEKRLLFTYRS